MIEHGPYTHIMMNIKSQPVVDEFCQFEPYRGEELRDRGLKGAAVLLARGRLGERLHWHDNGTRRLIIRVRHKGADRVNVRRDDERPQLLLQAQTR